MIVLAVAIHAASSTTPVAFPTSLVTTLIQVGLVGLLLIDVLGPQKFVVPRRMLSELSAERDKREAILQGTIERLEREVSEVKEINGQLQDMTRERLMPALTQAVDSQRAVVEVLSRRAGGGRD